MASDFQRPSSWMILVSMRATSRAVAPPGRRERAERRLEVRPVVAWMRPAACRERIGDERWLDVVPTPVHVVSVEVLVDGSVRQGRRSF